MQQRNYSTKQKELLAVVYGTQIHRCFLYGRKFKVVTDHAALKWLVTVKNHQCARLIRWVLKLAEYDFEIEHKAGKKHVNADCLSRHIAARNTPVKVREAVRDGDGAITREVMFREQQKDSYCQEIMKAIKAGKEEGFVITADGLLYEGHTLEEARLVVPDTLILPIIEIHHDKVFAGHQRIKRTCDSLRLNYIRPTLNRDVEQYVRQCESCAKLKSGRNPTAPLGELPETFAPLTFVCPIELMTGEQPSAIFDKLIPPYPGVSPRSATQEDKALQAYARMKIRAHRRAGRRKRGQVRWIPRLQEAVLLRTRHQSDMAKGVTSKFQRPYEGPYYITRIVNPSIIEISDARGKIKGIFNKGSLKKFRTLQDVLEDDEGGDE